MPSWRRNLARLAVLSALTAPAGAQDVLDCARGRLDPGARAMADEVNRLRTDPAGYARIIEAHFATLQGRRYRVDGMNMIMTEDRPAVEEAIRALRRQRPVPALIPSACLSAAAADHVDDQGPTGRTGHQGRGNSGPSDRVMRHVAGRAFCGENIQYGLRSVRAIVIGLVVDDGVRGRGHRRNLLDPRYRSFGAASGPHARFRTMAVQLFCFNAVRGR